MDVEAFHFLRPEWLLALIPVAVLAWYWVRRSQTGSGWESAIDDELLNVLLDETHHGSNRWLRNIMLIGLTIACLGLAGPTWEKLPQDVEQKNDALIILLDLSLSMLAEDVKPSRIERARQKVIDVLRMRDEGLTALIAYAGDAHAVVPLTDDVATIENLLPALGPEMMPVPGSNPDHALQLAHELFENSVLQQGRLLMVTDGIDSINSVTRHRHPAFPISVIGIGTLDGGPIPLDRLRQPGKYLLTQEGNRIVAMLDPERLQEVAGLSYGRYAPAVLGDSDILQALATVLPGEDETLDVEREFDTWFDQGHWLALLLIPFMLSAFRKGVLLNVPGFLVLGASLIGAGLPGSAQAATAGDIWDSLWMNSDQQGRKALLLGEPEKAVTLFQDPLWQAAARYRSGDYGGALNGFSSDASITGKYNQANSLARLGEYEPAIGLYTDVLSVDPDHEDAQFNKELLERLLQEQQEAQQQNEDQQSQANNEDSESEQDQQQNQDQSEQDQQSDESEQKQDESESEQQNEQSGDQQQTEAEQDETARDEKQEALEQWLRRVPDDPGGLLKRKFTHETKQRLRRGEYENRRGEKIW